MRKCNICGKEATPKGEPKCILYRPSNIAYFYCDKHWKVALQKPANESIKDYWERVGNTHHKRP